MTDANAGALSTVIRAFALRELRDRRNVILILGLIILGVMHGDAEGVQARAMLRDPAFDVQHLKTVSIFLSIVLAGVFARRIQTDRQEGWLGSAIVSGAMRPDRYLLGVSLVGLAFGTLLLLLGAGAYLIAWSHASRASALAGLTTLPSILLFWVSCLAFGTAVAAWQRHILGLVATPVVLILLPLYGLMSWIIRHEREPSWLATKLVFAFAPPRPISLQPSILLYHVIYVSAVVLIARLGVAKTLRRLEQ